MKLSTSILGESRKILTLHRHRDGVSSSKAQSCHTLFDVATNHFMEQSHQNSSSTATNRVAERYRSTIYVYFAWLKSQLLDYGDGLNGECLVYFIKVDFFL